MTLDVSSILPGAPGDRHGRDRLFAHVAARLASGRRIVDASDDAAGLAIADQLLRDHAVATRAARNVSDGLSALEIAGGGLRQLSDLTTRMAELATRAASGLLDDAQRATVAAEFDALGAEADRIVQTTAWGDQPLLQSGGLAIHAGLDATPASGIAVTLPDASAGTLGLTGLSLATAADARAALDALSAVHDRLAASQSTIAGAQARLTSVSAGLATESATAAARITDTDFATETAPLASTRLAIYAHVATLAHAHRSARTVLDLLV